MLVEGTSKGSGRGLPDLPLRIALVHSPRAGAVSREACEAVRAQAAALRRIGCEVSIVRANGSQRPQGLLRAACTGAGLTLGFTRGLETELRRLRPHVVHVHDPAFALGWLRRWSGPLIATVHGYPPMCVAAAAPPRVAGRPTARDPLLSRADRIAVPSQLGWDLCRKAGLPVERLTLVPDFVPAQAPAGVVPDGAGRWAFVGRLSRETGVVEMLRRWPTAQPLDVVGDGVLAHECRRLAPPSVRFVGPLDRQEVRRRMPWWTGLIFPHQSMDAAPTVYPDALAAGLPVVAWAGSSAAYGVRLHETGAVVGPGERLNPVLALVRHHGPALRQRCRQVYRAEFSEERWTERTLRVYRQAAQRRRTLRGATREG